MRCLTKTIHYTSDIPVRLVFFSDTHDGSRYFARNHFKKFLSSSMDHPNAWLLGIGDHVDALVPADAKRFQISTVEERFLASENPDEILDAQAKDFCQIMKPYQGRLLGLAMGNHEQAIGKRYGFSIHRQICRDLECDDLGYTFLLLLKLTNPGYRHTRSVTIYGTHGFGGGGRTEGGSITKYARAVQYYSADIFLSGHDHDSWVKKVTRIGVNNSGKIQNRDLILANTGSFLKTLSEGATPSWAETRGFPPRNLGGVVLELKPDHHWWVNTSVID